VTANNFGDNYRGGVVVQGDAPTAISPRAEATP
jgi:hypothetical protein